MHQVMDWSEWPTSGIVLARSHEAERVVARLAAASSSAAAATAAAAARAGVSHAAAAAR